MALDLEHDYFGEVADVFGIESYMQSVVRGFGFGVKDIHTPLARYAQGKSFAPDIRPNII